MAETISCAQCGADDFETVYQHRAGLVANGACRRCGLGYLSPRPSASDTDRLYAGYRQAYPDEFLAAPESPFAQAAAARASFAARWVRPGARVLEVGCGYGHFVAAGTAAGYRVEGIEPSGHQVRFARDRLGLLGIVQGTIDDLPTDGSFDVVAMFHVLEHLRDPQEAIVRLAQAVRPGGLVWLDVPHALRLPCDAIEHLYVAAGHHLYSFTPRVLAAMAARAGLESLHLSHDPLPAVYRANLRLLARQIDGEPVVPPSRPRETIESLARHHRRLEALGARVAAQLESWHAAGRRVALYGAGFHTLGLLDLCGAGAREIDCVIDDDAGKHGTLLAGLPVVGQGALSDRKIDAVLVSSLAAEPAIVERLNRVVSPGCEVAGVYGARRGQPSSGSRNQGVELR